MKYAYWLPIIVLLFINSITHRNKLTAVKNVLKIKKRKDKTKMVELAEKFIDKDCLIYSFNGSQFTGIIKEVTNGAILVENNNTVEAINLDYVVRIREYPKNKNGKKKSVVLD